MKLKSLSFREDYMNPGKGLVGVAEFENEQGRVEYKLTHTDCQQILLICSESLTKACEEKAKSIKNAIGIEVRRAQATIIGNDLPSEF